MKADGSSRVNLLNDASSSILAPTFCGDHIVFTGTFHSGSDALNIWRTDPDGSNMKQLTDGTADLGPVCSGDGKWIFYRNSALQLMRVPVQGGKSGTVPGVSFPNSYQISLPALTTDGKTLGVIVYFAEPNTGREYTKLALLSLNSTSATRLLPVDQRLTGLLGFSPDGKAVAYPIEEKGVENLWVQPLDGSQGGQITDFTADRIDEFGWSPDGNTLAVVHSHRESDVILIRDNQ